MSRCLLYTEELEENDMPKKNYYDYQKVDLNNYFFKQLFEKMRYNFSPLRYLSCEDFLQMTSIKRVHNFLKHCNQGKNISPEDRLIEAQRLSNIKINKTFLVQHNGSFDFENPDEIIDSFF